MLAELRGMIVKLHVAHEQDLQCFLILAYDLSPNRESFDLHINRLKFGLRKIRFRGELRGKLTGLVSLQPF